MTAIDEDPIAALIGLGREIAENPDLADEDALRAVAYFASAAGREIWANAAKAQAVAGAVIALESLGTPASVVCDGDNWMIRHRGRAVRMATAPRNLVDSALDFMRNIARPAN